MPHIVDEQESFWYQIFDNTIMKKRIIYLACLTYFSLFAWTISSVSAKSNGLIVAPPVWEIRMKAGTTYRIGYKLSGASGQTYVARLASLEAPNANSIRWKAASAVVQASLDEQDAWGKPLVFDSDGNKTLHITLSTPGETKAQDVYDAILLESAFDPPSGNMVVQTAETIVLPLYISILSADQNIVGKVVQVRVASPLNVNWGGRSYAIVDSFLPVPIVTTFANTGRHFYTVKGRILVESGNKKQSILLQKQRVLSAQQTNLHTSFTTCKKWYCPSDPTHILKGSYLGGYEVRAETSYGTHGKSSSKSAYFFAFPFEHTLIIIVLFIVGWLVKVVGGMKSKR